MIEITADFQSSQNDLIEFLLLDIADLFFQSSYRILCLTVKNHVVEKTGLGIYHSSSQQRLVRRVLVLTLKFEIPQQPIEI
jgi:hypothetical protein